MPEIVEAKPVSVVSRENPDPDRCWSDVILNHDAGANSMPGWSRPNRSVEIGRANTAGCDWFRLNDGECNLSSEHTRLQMTMLPTKPSSALTL
jgi:hypothetical protein